MKTNLITFDGEQITVTQYGHDDYDIYFYRGDYSVRGSMLDIIKAFAEWQASELDEPVVWFPWLDRSISNPWIDPSARFPISSEQASEQYGLDNVLQFIIDACVVLRPDDDREEART